MYCRVRPLHRGFLSRDLSLRSAEDEVYGQAFDVNAFAKLPSASASRADRLAARVQQTHSVDCVRSWREAARRVQPRPPPPPRQQVQCKECGKKFPSMQRLHTHQSMTLTCGAATLACGGCGYKTTKNGLAQHRKKCRGRTAHCCSSCKRDNSLPYYFTDQNSLDAHRRLLHSQALS